MVTSHGGPLAAALQDLQHIFGDRLQAFVSYGPPSARGAASLAIVGRITADDLDRCAAHATSWHRAGCATPLLLTQEEFAGSLDAVQKNDRRRLGFRAGLLFEASGLAALVRLLAVR